MKFAVFVVSLVVLATLCASQDLEKIRPRPVCTYLVKCSYVEEPVWTTTDNRTCEVFRNGCILGIENCNRRINNQPEAIVIEKEKCQQLCKTSCPCLVKRPAPICGSYNDVLRNFGSRCEMENFICASGQTYSLYSEGFCPLKAEPIEIIDIPVDPEFPEIPVIPINPEIGIVPEIAETA